MAFSAMYRDNAVHFIDKDKIDIPKHWDKDMEKNLEGINYKDDYESVEGSVKEGRESRLLVEEADEVAGERVKIVEYAPKIFYHIRFLDSINSEKINK